MMLKCLWKKEKMEFRWGGRKAVRSKGGRNGI
jgi:hypothetical protein